MKRFPRLPKLRVSLVPLVVGLKTSSLAFATSVAVDLRFEARAQICEETALGLQICADESSPVGLEPIPLPFPGSSVDFTSAASFREGRYVVHFAGRVSRPVLSSGSSAGQEKVCLEFMQMILQEPVYKIIGRSSPQCLPALGGSAPLFLFGSTRLDDRLDETTFSLSLTGWMSSTPYDN